MPECVKEFATSTITDDTYKLQSSQCELITIMDTIVLSRPFSQSFLKPCYFIIIFDYICIIWSTKWFSKWVKHDFSWHSREGTLYINLCCNKTELILQKRAVTNQVFTKWHISPFISSCNFSEFLITDTKVTKHAVQAGPQIWLSRVTLYFGHSLFINSSSLFSIS